MLQSQTIGDETTEILNREAKLWQDPVETSVNSPRTSPSSTKSGNLTNTDIFQVEMLKNPANVSPYVSPNVSPISRRSRQSRGGEDRDNVGEAVGLNLTITPQKRQRNQEYDLDNDNTSTVNYDILAGEYPDLEIDVDAIFNSEDSNSSLCATETDTTIGRGLINNYTSDGSPTVMDGSSTRSSRSVESPLEEQVSVLKKRMEMKDEEIRRLNYMQKKLIEEHSTEKKKIIRDMHSYYSKQATQKIHDVYKKRLKAADEYWSRKLEERDKIISDLVQACDKYLAENGF